MSREPRAASAAMPTMPRSVPRWRPLTQVGRARSATDSAARGSWARVSLAMFLGIGMVFWPYQICGFGLISYLGGTLAVMLAAIWSAVASWKGQTALAHTLSIGLFIWGLALAGDQLLQRTGYAYAQLPWSCS